MEGAFSKTSDEVCLFFNVEEEIGLSDDQVKRQFERFGANGKFVVLFVNRGL